MQEFLKTGPARALEFEKAGLAWLAQAENSGGVPIVPVLGLDSRGLHLRRVPDGHATAEAAREFGARLAHTHAAGAPFWGAAPEGYHHRVGNKGEMPMSVRPQNDAPKTVSADGKTPDKNGALVIETLSIEQFADKETWQRESWGQWYAQERLLPCVVRATNRGALGAKPRQQLERVMGNIASGSLDSKQPKLVTTVAARCHGDLWAGNLMWGPDQVMLIDPAAHGGHAETDLAECSMFGTPFMNHIYDGYQEVSPLAPGWQDRIALHQLYMLTLHLALFGSAYLRPTLDAAAPYA